MASVTREEQPGLSSEFIVVSGKSKQLGGDNKDNSTVQSMGTELKSLL
jgi:hypothetical protein